MLYITSYFVEKGFNFMQLVKVTILCEKKGKIKKTQKRRRLGGVSIG